VIARALEQIGDRWTLLVIRDLLTGAKRFTDLMDRLGGITPKTLSLRLDELQAAGLVAADRAAGRREVRYRLTAAGSELGPVVEALSRWGLRHTWRWPVPGEPLHAEHLLRAAVQAMNLTANDSEAARWLFRLDGTEYSVESDGRQWSVTTEPGPDPVQVTVIATTRDFAAFIFGDPGTDITVIGEAGQASRCRTLIRTLAAAAAIPPDESFDRRPGPADGPSRTPGL
jgi:DNA-binding HxlR family transcriptional regulator